MGGQRHVITMDELTRLEIGDDNQLYWDGEPVVTMSKFSIPWWAQALAAGAALSTIGLFVLGVVGLLK